MDSRTPYKPKAFEEASPEERKRYYEIAYHCSEEEYAEIMERNHAIRSKFNRTFIWKTSDGMIVDMSNPSQDLLLEYTADLSYKDYISDNLDFNDYPKYERNLRNPDMHAWIIEQRSNIGHKEEKTHYILFSRSTDANHVTVPFADPDPRPIRMLTAEESNDLKEAVKISKRNFVKRLKIYWNKYIEPMLNMDRMEMD